jgi:hypothetical protein
MHLMRIGDRMVNLDRMTSACFLPEDGDEGPSLGIAFHPPTGKDDGMIYFGGDEARRAWACMRALADHGDVDPTPSIVELNCMAAETEPSQ